MKVVIVGYGSRGEVEPFVVVGRELLRRGHDVCMAVPPNMLDFVESVGLASTAYGPDSREAMNPATNVFRAVAGMALTNPLGMLGEVTEYVTQVKTAKGKTLTSLAEGADLIMAGFNEQGLAANVADYYRIPLIVLHYFPAKIWPSTGLYAGVTKQTDDHQRRTLGLPEACGPSASLEIQAYDQISLPGLAAEWIDPDGPPSPFVGALTLELPTDADDEVLSWIAAGTPPIYFGFGSWSIESPAETVAVISAACAQLGERALIYSGSNDFTQVPRFDHVKIVGAVNYAAVFPACRAVVHHGGAGTTAAAMRAGIPSLILWFWLDQPMWADGLTRLKTGSGRQFHASTLDSLVADLRSILTPERVDRAREVAGQMTQAAQSVASACDLAEAVAGNLSRVR
jgi:UDP:flavonoid glycosyltransferase YjiC (YdhE family)